MKVSLSEIYEKEVINLNDKLKDSDNRFWKTFKTQSDKSIQVGSDYEIRPNGSLGFYKEGHLKSAHMA